MDKASVYYSPSFEDYFLCCLLTLLGIHGWAIFSLVGLLLGLMSYREKLPLTMKSCFYPLIGDGIFGWIGDFIDVFSIIATLFGVCTSLGLGARQVATGLSVLSERVDADSISLQVTQFSIYLRHIFQILGYSSHRRCSFITICAHFHR